MQAMSRECKRHKRVLKVKILYAEKGRLELHSYHHLRRVSTAIRMKVKTQELLLLIGF